MREKIGPSDSCLMFMHESTKVQKILRTCVHPRRVCVLALCTHEQPVEINTQEETLCTSVHIMCVQTFSVSDPGLMIVQGTQKMRRFECLYTCTSVATPGLRTFVSL